MIMILAKWLAEVDERSKEKTGPKAITDLRTLVSIEKKRLNSDYQANKTSH